VRAVRRRIRNLVAGGVDLARKRTRAFARPVARGALRWRAADHDGVEAGAAEEEPPAALVAAPGGVEPEQPVRQHLSTFPASSSRRWGSGQATRTPTRPFRKARKNPSPSRSSKRSPSPPRRGAPPGRGRAPRPGPARSAGGPALARVRRALQEDRLRVEEDSVAPLAELPQGVEQALRVLPEPRPGLEHTGHYTARRAARDGA